MDGAEIFINFLSLILLYTFSLAMDFEDLQFYGDRDDEIIVNLETLSDYD